jgi:peptidylprolyl isomerase
VSRRQQRKRRHRPFDPLRAAGYDNRPRRHGFLYHVFHTKWVVTLGMAIIGIAMVFGTCFSLQAGNPSSSASQNRIRETATPEPSATPAPDASATPAASPTATPPPVQRRFAAAPEFQLTPGARYFATIRTDKGDIRIELFPDAAPQAVNSFVWLARQRYYDGLTFTRVIPGFIAQAGDGGSGAPGYGLPVEPNDLRHDGGAVALARNNVTGQISGQFYIVLAPQPQLDGKDTVIGRVVSGQEVLDRLTPRNPERSPTAPPGDKILAVVVEEIPAT